MERRKSGHNRINVAYRSNNGIRYEHLDISIIIPLCGFIRRSNDLRGKCLYRIVRASGRPNVVQAQGIVSGNNI